MTLLRFLEDPKPTTPISIYLCPDLDPYLCPCPYLDRGLYRGCPAGNYF
jgi:hypothetical protein